MPNSTVRANAPRLPKTTKHPDTEIFALGVQLGEAHKRLEVSRGHLAEAIRAVKHATDVQALRKTEADAGFGLFVGSNVVGCLYRQDEIARIRAFARAQIRTIAEKEEEAAAPYYRALEILDAWAGRDERDVTRASDVDRAHRALQSEYDGLATELILMKPATVAGVIATKALVLETSLDEAIDDQLDVELGRFGPDEQNVMLAMTRDLLRLANAGAAR